MAQISTKTTAAEGKGKGKTAEAVKMLEEGVKNAFSSDNFQRYLEAMYKFHDYSIRNSLLIWLQNPEATLVAGYRSWETNFKRHVKKGEKGLTILAPCAGKATRVNQDGEEEDIHYTYFKATTVFDVSQTEGEEIPSICSELTGSVDGYSGIVKRLMAFSPVPVEFGDINGGAKGQYNIAEKKILVRADLSEVQTVKTLIHEIAHSILHSDMKCRKTREQREVEAEGTAYVVSRAIGVDTSDYSFDYVASWSSDKEAKELTQSLGTIRETADKILAGIGK